MMSYVDKCLNNGWVVGSDVVEGTGISLVYAA